VSNGASYVFFFFRFYRYSIISTGGTATSLESAGVNVTKVEEITKFPEMVRQPAKCS
jgi:AICAR transformylase/IMP cyclohydrolase PurH